MLLPQGERSCREEKGALEEREREREEEGGRERGMNRGMEGGKIVEVERIS